MTDDIERLRVELDDRAYEILVGPRLIESAGREIQPLLRRRQVVIVSDETVARHCLPQLRDSLSKAGITHHTVLLPPGEETKDLNHYGRLTDEILSFGIERGTMLMALGGGVVGDVTGFAAATLLRGIDFAQIPTTLLAQVDSSVGGKTGINTRIGKNLIGAFYQPRLVLADTDTLATLPYRELLAGYAEVAKYGLIRDAGFFSWLEAEGRAVCDLAPAPLRRAVMTSCAISPRRDGPANAALGDRIGGPTRGSVDRAYEQRQEGPRWPDHTHPAAAHRRGVRDEGCAARRTARFSRWGWVAAPFSGHPRPGRA